ncbi:putative regulator of late gene expression [Salmonella enterica subsp. enterica serovar Typhimurium str. 798]|uniref:contractile injection system protein, VgrG/Pvc8 family n=1 Tax=Salmonella enterica TaxID=28901 RepID=UPI000254D9D3|nr:contractile injection system protein, VgrG/Pvc8 family [Salmonella enterica]AFD59600.1 putative regulator of late gene expression [Salmonella enterica subsp. enterica serovar Typhimurium str. 798]
MNFNSDLLNLNSKSPAFSITIEGKDVTTVMDARLMSLTLTDNRGFEADQLDLELDDADGQIVLPRRGAVIHLALGQDLTDKALDHMDQTNESDASFLMKLARQYGAIASVKDGNLLFIRQGQGRTASGKPLPVITITRKAGDGHRFTLADRGAYTGVIASWLHTREPRKKETTSVKRRRKKATTPKEPEAKQGDYLVGTDENVLVLNRTYANRSNAERAAKMQWERLQRGVASFSLQLAEGRADLYTEMPVKVTGFKQPIDDAEWTITTLTHSVSPDNGFTTSMELEVKIDGLEIE